MRARSSRCIQATTAHSLSRTKYSEHFCKMQTPSCKKQTLSARLAVGNFSNLEAPCEQEASEKPQVHLGYQWAESVHDRVLQAVLQGAKTQCSVCGLMGATVRCKTAGCTLKFHLPCAIDADCHLFPATGHILCKVHADTNAEEGLRLPPASIDTRLQSNLERIELPAQVQPDLANGQQQSLEAPIAGLALAAAQKPAGAERDKTPEPTSSDNAREQEAIGVLMTLGDANGRRGRARGRVRRAPKRLAAVGRRGRSGPPPPTS
ncbi:hypothetical protein WJX75_009182 [Coccomyxa subellipsoidea]|uniref:Zinc finger PHD-type domain-containing protein n=1 Tax=Coccomyxa subellipsoidea TaxID=248742 RepID=A0ABR2YIV7_9CHLO